MTTPSRPTQGEWSTRTYVIGLAVALPIAVAVGIAFDLWVSDRVTLHVVFGSQVLLWIVLIVIYRRQRRHKVAELTASDTEHPA